MDYFSYFWWLFVMCVGTSVFYIPAGILCLYGMAATCLAATRAGDGSRLSGGLFVPLLLGMLSLVIGTVYRDSNGNVEFWAQVANLAVWLLQVPLIANACRLSGVFWVGALCF